MNVVLHLPESFEGVRRALRQQGFRAGGAVFRSPGSRQRIGVVGRGGLPQDPEASLPALYLAGRDVNPNPQAGAYATQASSAPLRTTVRLTMRCG